VPARLGREEVADLIGHHNEFFRRHRHARRQ
jgi:hypothetical protein